MIRIHPISGNKKQYLDLLLLADEQESMIDCYLERGEMFILSDNDTVKASCVITCEDKGIYEIKSIAVYPEYQRQGYGRQLIAFVLEHYKDRCHTMLVGTGDSPLTIPFYESCGFAYSHRVPDFFIDNYDHPIMEAKLCQSCGMPLSSAEVLGTNADGSLNEEYCTYCYQHGNFAQDCTMDEMIEHCAQFTDEFNKDSGMNFTKEEAIAGMKEFFPTLKRWQSKQ